MICAHHPYLTEIDILDWLIKQIEIHGHAFVQVPFQFRIAEHGPNNKRVGTYVGVGKLKYYAMKVGSSQKWKYAVERLDRFDDRFTKDYPSLEILARMIHKRYKQAIENKLYDNDDWKHSDDWK